MLIILKESVDPPSRTRYYRTFFLFILFPPILLFRSSRLVLKLLRVRRFLLLRVKLHSLHQSLRSVTRSRISGSEWSTRLLLHSPPSSFSSSGTTPFSFARVARRFTGWEILRSPRARGPPHEKISSR